MSLRNRFQFPPSPGMAKCDSAGMNRNDFFNNTSHILSDKKRNGFSSLKSFRNVLILRYVVLFLNR